MQNLNLFMLVYILVSTRATWDSDANISMTYLPDLSSDFVPFHFRGLMHVGIQYDYNRDDIGGKVDVA